jgi:hypothetical protein
VTTQVGEKNNVLIKKEMALEKGLPKTEEET